MASIPFPGESFPRNLVSWSLGVNISREEIEKGLLTSPERKHIALFVVGCIDYTFISDPGHHHQTRFIFDLHRFVDGVPCLVSPDDGQIPANNLRLQDFPLGVGRYAD